MEEVLVVVLQGLVEFLVEMLIYFGIDLPWRRDDGRAGCGWVVLLLLLGAGCGWAADLLWPRLLLPYFWLRLANLAVAPLAAGALSWAVADRRRRRGAALIPVSHFWSAFAFTLAFNVVRFAFGQR